MRVSAALEYSRSRSFDQSGADPHNRPAGSVICDVLLFPLHLKHGQNPHGKFSQFHQLAQIYFLLVSFLSISSIQAHRPIAFSAYFTRISNHRLDPSGRRMAVCVRLGVAPCVSRALVSNVLQLWNVHSFAIWAFRLAQNRKSNKIFMASSALNSPLPKQCYCHHTGLIYFVWTLELFMPKHHFLQSSRRR